MVSSVIQQHSFQSKPMPIDFYFTNLTRIFKAISTSLYKLHVQKKPMHRPIIQQTKTIKQKNIFPSILGPKMCLHSLANIDPKKKHILSKGDGLVPITFATFIFPMPAFYENLSANFSSFPPLFFRQFKWIAYKQCFTFAASNSLKTM